MALSAPAIASKRAAASRKLPDAEAKTVTKPTPARLVKPATPALAAEDDKSAENDMPHADQRATTASAAPTQTNSKQNSIPLFSIKDMTMDMSTNFGGIQTAMSDAQAQAKAAFEKSSSAMGEMGEFTKGNVEAMIESSKILAEGYQTIGSNLVAESRIAFETMTGDIKELAAAKSPTDFLKVQSEMVRKNFDNVVAYGSKNSELFLKLMSDAAAPLSGRMSLAAEKVRQTAASTAVAA